MNSNTWHCCQVEDQIQHWILNWYVNVSRPDMFFFTIRHSPPCVLPSLLISQCSDVASTCGTENSEERQTTYTHSNDSVNLFTSRQQIFDHLNSVALKLQYNGANDSVRPDIIVARVCRWTKFCCQRI